MSSLRQIQGLVSGLYSVGRCEIVIYPKICLENQRMNLENGRQLPYFLNFGRIICILMPYLQFFINTVQIRFYLKKLGTVTASL
jgi:hypothetical protein